MLGYGLSTLVLGNLAGKLMAAEGLGWRVTYMGLGAAIGAVLLLAALVLKFPPADTVFPPPRPKMVKSGAGEDFSPRDYTTPEMVRRFTFWRFFLCTITTSAVGNTVISIARDLTISAGAAPAAATMLVGILSVCNGLGRIFCGMMFDLMGRRRTMLIFGAVTIAAAAVTLMAVLAGSLPLMIAGLGLVGLSYGASPTTNAAVTAEFYGARYYAMNFGVANTMLIPASFMATLAGSLVASTGAFVLPCVILLGSSIISMLLCLTIRRP
jgi:OFA family oxalate/formate antiporter-like MFS transporter